MKSLTQHIYRIIFVVAFSLPLAVQAALPEFTNIAEEAKDLTVYITNKTKSKRMLSNDGNIPE